MAIYRGPGGAGDAIADTANTSVVAVESAAAALNSANNAAASAQVAQQASENATTSADQAADSLLATQNVAVAVAAAQEQFDTLSQEAIDTIEQLTLGVDQGSLELLNNAQQRIEEFEAFAQAEFDRIDELGFEIEDLLFENIANFVANLDPIAAAFDASTAQVTTLANDARNSAEQAQISANIATAAANFQGDWDPAQVYPVGQSVLFEGIRYISLVTTTAGAEPDETPAEWFSLAGEGGSGSVPIQVANNNANFRLLFSGEVGTLNSVLIDDVGGTYNPSTNIANLNISGNADSATLASNAQQFGGEDPNFYLDPANHVGVVPRTNLSGTYDIDITGTIENANNALTADVATLAETAEVTSTTTDSEFPLVFVTGATTGPKTLLLDAQNGTYNPSTNTATINITGTAASATSAATALDAANLGGQPPSFYLSSDNLTGIIPAALLSGTYDIDITGSVDQAALADVATTVVDGAITNQKIANGAVTSNKLAAQSVGTAQLVDGSISNAKYGPKQISEDKIADGNISRRLFAPAVQPYIPAGGGTGFRNAVVNGAMQVQGPGVTFTNNTAGYGGPQMWQGANVGAGGSFVMQGGVITLDGGSFRTVRQTVTAPATAINGTNFWSGITQTFVGEDISLRLSAVPINVSFVFNSNITGKFAVALVNRAAMLGETGPQAISMVGTFEATAVTPRFVSISFNFPTRRLNIGVTQDEELRLHIGGIGRTGGDSSDGTAGLYESLTLATSSCSNWAAVQGAVIEVSQVMVEAGTDYTLYEYNDYSIEQSRIARYYEKSYPDTLLPGTANIDEGFEYFTQASPNIPSLGFVGFSHKFAVPKYRIPEAKFFSFAGTNGQISVRNNTTGLFEPLASSVFSNTTEPVIVTKSMIRCGALNAFSNPTNSTTLGLHWQADARPGFILPA